MLKSHALPYWGSQALPTAFLIECAISGAADATTNSVFEDSEFVAQNSLRLSQQYRKQPKEPKDVLCSAVQKVATLKL